MIDAAGLWRASSPDRKAACVLALNRLPQTGGFGVHIETCAIPQIAAAAAWRPTPTGVELLGRDGAVLISLRKISHDRFEAVEGLVMEREAVSG